MTLYFDSSVLLTDYLDQPGAAWARAAWERDEERISSFLLLAEVPVALRRSLAGSGRRGAKALADRLARFDDDAAGISILFDAASMVDLVRKDPRFAGARTLDALHAAAAWLFQASSDSPVLLLSADRQLLALAAAIGLRGEGPPGQR